MQEENRLKGLRVAVLGGTGRSGKYVVNELKEKGYSVKLLARSPDKIPGKHPLIEIVTGSARNYATIQRLLSDCNTVISTLGPSKGEDDTCSVAVSHVIRVMKQLNIKRYIEIAGLGLEVQGDQRRMFTRLIAKVIKFLYPARVNDRVRGYELLTASNIDWTIIRCPTIQLTDEHRTMKVSLEDSPGHKVSAADLAEFMVTLLSNGQYIKKCPFVAS